MKKTILLASLVASITTLAATEGHVNYTFKGEINSKYANQQTANEFKVPETFVETEVKVKGSGLSFGGEFKAKDIKLGEDNKAHFLNHSKVFAKYELPEIKGVKSFVKATAEPKFIGDDKGSAELEGQVSYKYGEFTFGLNSKTNFPFAQKTADNYGKDVKSTHKVFVESEKDKDVFKGIKDVKANVEVKHDYRKLAEKDPKAAEAVDYVKGEVSAKYDATKDFAVEGKAGFKVNVSEFTKKHDDFIKNDSGDNKHDVVLGGVKINDYLDNFNQSGWIREVTGLHREYANVKLTYTGVKGLTLSANPFVDYTEAYRGYKGDQLAAGGYLLAYGTSLDAKYVLLNNKLTLTGNSLLAGIKSVRKDSIVNPAVDSDYTIGVYTAKLGAKYDYAVDSKLTVSPELTVSSAILTNSDKTVGATLNGFVTLKPEVNAVYKATDKLELKGGVSLSANFKNITKDSNNKVVSTKSLKLEPSASLVYKPVEGLEVSNKVELPIKFNEKSDADKSLEYKGLDVKTELNIKYSWK